MTDEADTSDELVFASLAERPDLEEERLRLVKGAWPGFIGRNEKVNADWDALFQRHRDLQFVLLSRRSGAVLGTGNVVPFSWDGRGDSLPEGVDDVLARGLEDHALGRPCTALSALQAVVALSRRGHGLSRRIVAFMRELGRTRGYRHLVAPVRPNQKSLYPTISMERYITWTRPDGLPLDPWLRVHRRLGASVVTIAPRSMVVTGTVAEWESWTGLAFPDTGTYAVPGALELIHIDRERDIGRYEEPNVWMHHALAGAD